MKTAITLMCLIFLVGCGSREEVDAPPAPPSPWESYDADEMQLSANKAIRLTTGGMTNVGLQNPAAFKANATDIDDLDDSAAPSVEELCGNMLFSDGVETPVLPAASLLDGCRFWFMSQTTDALTVTPNAGEAINFEGTTQTANETIASTTAHAILACMVIDSVVYCWNENTAASWDQED